MKSQKSVANKATKSLDQINKGISSSIAINSRFSIQNIKQKQEEYNLYEGIDTLRLKWVHIYLRPSKEDNTSHKNQKQARKTLFCPRILQSSSMQQQNIIYNYQVHERFGPSLAIMLKHIKGKIKQRELLHLLLELLKLIEKIWSSKLVCGQLHPNYIIFDQNPLKNDLFLLNSFRLQKKGSQKKVNPTRYCSKGVHLGRKIGTKDDLQSVCYILIEVFTNGEFLSMMNIKECQQLKMTQKIEQFAKGLPPILIDFYHYVINLNYDEDINFYYWKTLLSRILTVDIVCRPYRFLLKKNKPNLAIYDEIIENQSNEAQLLDCEGLNEIQENSMQQSLNRISKMGKFIPKINMND